MEDLPTPARHPGEVLADDFMAPLGIGATELSASIGLDVEMIDEILAGAQSITEEIAERIATFVQTEAIYWLTLQAEYDLQ
jgi:addiction module HigA family antidote